MTTSLEKILIERDVEGAKAYVKSTISDLLMNRLDLSLLVVTKVQWLPSWLCEGRQAQASLPASRLWGWTVRRCSIQLGKPGVELEAGEAAECHRLLLERLQHVTLVMRGAF